MKAMQNELGTRLGNVSQHVFLWTSNDLLVIWYSVKQKPEVAKILCNYQTCTWTSVHKVFP